MFPPPVLWDRVVRQLQLLERGQRAVLIAPEHMQCRSLQQWLQQKRHHKIELPPLRHAIEPPEGWWDSKSMPPSGRWYAISI